MLGAGTHMLMFSKVGLGSKDVSLYESYGAWWIWAAWAAGETTSTPFCSVPGRVAEVFFAEVCSFITFPTAITEGWLDIFFLIIVLL